jgi:hypothetical protein
MSLIARNEQPQRTLLPAGNYVARCYEVIEIGTVMDEYMGEVKVQKKVRIGWEFPTKTRVFKEGTPAQPYALSREYTNSLFEGSHLRDHIESWFGKKLTPEQVEKGVDLTKLVGRTCMINVIHETSKKGTVREKVQNISPIPEGLTCPPAVNPPKILVYDDWKQEIFDKMPQFIKEKMQGSKEYTTMMTMRQGAMPQSPPSSQQAPPDDFLEPEQDESPEYHPDLDRDREPSITDDIFNAPPPNEDESLPF